MANPAPQTALDSTLALLSRAQAGDPLAREVIAERYQAALRRFAHGRLPAPARGLLDTDDIVQVSVERTLARLENFDPASGGSLLAYLRRCVLNRIRDEIRRSQHRPRLEVLPDDLPARGMDPLEQVISQESLDRYEAALAELPADHQEAFMMRIEMGCGYREIAEALGRPSADAARQLVRRAVRALARALERAPGP